MSIVGLAIWVAGSITSGMVCHAISSERRLLNFIKAGAFEHNGKLFSVREVA